MNFVLRFVDFKFDKTVILHSTLYIYRTKIKLMIFRTGDDSNSNINVLYYVVAELLENQKILKLKPLFIVDEQLQN